MPEEIVAEAVRPQASLPAHITGLELPDEARALPLREFRDLMEKQYIKAKLEDNAWNISRTATQLGIERTNLHKKMRTLGLHREGTEG